MRSEPKSQNSSSMEKIPKTPTYQQRLKAAQERWVHLKPPWHPHLPGQEVAVPEAKNIAGDNMSPEEHYGFEVKGFLIVRNVLNKSELMECNDLIDQGKMPLGLCANPILLRYIEQLCGLAYRLDKPLTMLEQ